MSATAKGCCWWSSDVCSSDLGQELGQGRKLPEILLGLGGKVAEGVLTTRAALGLARQHNIEMPITEQMELILNQGKDPREAIKSLMLRPGKNEL